VLEYAGGGDLLKVLKTEASIPEERAKIIFI
jgi:hypothetical protein